MEEMLVMLLEFFLEGFGLVFSALVAAIIAFFNRKKIRQRFAPIDYGEKNQKRKRNYTRSSIIDEKITSRIKEEDPLFDEIAFKEWSKNIFVNVQKALSVKDITNIRGNLDSNLCEHYQLLLHGNEQAGFTNIIEVLKVNFVDFSSFTEDNEKELLEVAINVVNYDYDVENITEKIIRGSKTIKNRTTYKLVFYRKNGSKTRKVENDFNCPNCGAKVEVIQKQCEYCKTLILNGATEWVLNHVEKY